MPTPSPKNTQTRTFDDMALPYVTNNSPVGTNPYYGAGLNVLTSITGKLERRPGFSLPLEINPFTFVNCRNIWVWQRWDDQTSGTTRGAFIAMANDIHDGESIVYKYQIGTDLQFTEIWRDSTSENPFFFVDSNNQCYFGNGTAGNMKRYDGTTVYNWGIVKPSAPTINVGGTTVANQRPTAYQTPDPAFSGSGAFQNAQLAFDTDLATAATGNAHSVQYLTGPSSTATASDSSSCRWYGFSNTPAIGQALYIDYKFNFTGVTGNPVTALIEYTIDGGSNWITAVGVLSASAARTTFNVTLSDTQDFSLVEVRASIVGGTATVTATSTMLGSVYNIYIGDAVVVAPTGSSLSSTNGYSYVQTYGYGTGTGATAIPVGESSPSELSESTGAFEGSGVSVSLIGSTDPQVNQIHLYRNTEGGALDPEEMREISGSPFANVSATILDTTLDDDLGGTAPAINRNDPPPPMNGGGAYAGRIWGFSSNILYYSGFEEISQGVPEECFPSGLDGNNRPYAKDIKSLGVLPDGIAVSTSIKIHKVEGDSLDTFRFYGLLEKRGTKSVPNMSSIGGTISWLDTSGTVWNSEFGEISVPIRPDTQSINQNYSAVIAHISGNFHWIIVMDGANGKLLVFDIDKRQWIPPWDVGDSIGCIGSFETEDGVTNLLIARNGTKILKLVPSSYNDDGDIYPAFVSTNQFNIAPEQSATWKGVIDWVEWKRDTTALSSASQLTDDDPNVGTFVPMQVMPSPEITQGRYMLTERATSNFPTAQLATLKFEWPAEDRNFKLYQMSICSHPVGT